MKTIKFIYWYSLVMSILIFLSGFFIKSDKEWYMAMSLAFNILGIELFIISIIELKNLYKNE